MAVGDKTRLASKNWQRKPCQKRHLATNKNPSQPLRAERGFTVCTTALSGRSGGARTPSPRFWRPVLYQLSYTPKCSVPDNKTHKSPFVDRRPYLMTVATTPAPTVRPPSRIAKRRPSSIAIGAINVTVIAMLSPGITISVPSGNTTDPVTSVVRK